MGDNINNYDDQEEVEEVILLSDLPQHYQIRLTELASVIKSLFAVGDCDGGGVDSDVLTFLEMCHQVFDLDFNSKDGQSGECEIGRRLINDCAVSGVSANSPASIDAAATELLNTLMGKYRSFYRKRFRGFIYLTSQVLEDTFQLAYNETKMLYFEKRKSTPTASEKVGIMSLLRNGMLHEFQWIEKVNEYKRQQLLDSIKTEVIQEFQTAIKIQFSSAFSDENDDSDFDFSTTFYEEAELRAKVDRMVEAAVEDFKKQIPYKEEPEELTKIGMTLEAELKDKIIRDLLEKNSRNKENAESFMERLVDHTTNIYRDRLIKFIAENPIVEPDQVLYRHVGLQLELAQKFQNKESRFQNPKHHDQFLNLLNESIHSSLKGILAHCSETGALMLTECEKNSKIELDKCMRRIARIFGDYGLSQYFDDLCERVEANLKKSLDEIRHCTIINVEKMEETLETARLQLTDIEATNPAQLFQKDNSNNE